MDFEKSDVKRIKTQVRLMNDSVWSVIDDERGVEGKEFGEPSDIGLEKLEVREESVV